MMMTSKTGTTPCRLVLSSIALALALFGLLASVAQAQLDDTALCPPTRPETEDPCPVDGQQCAYNYVDASCEEGVRNCIPTAYASCDANIGWRIAMASIGCFGAPQPPGFGTPCDPELTCPPTRPETEDPCPVDGQQCEYNFVDASCEEGISNCIPTAYADCNGAFGWRIAMASIGCFWAPQPPGFGTPCDPDPPPSPVQVCPETTPEAGGRCITDGYAAGLSCTYGHSLLGCDATTMGCSPQAYFDCDESSDQWFLAVPDYFCDGGIYPDNFLEPCDPSTPTEFPTTVTPGSNPTIQTPKPVPESTSTGTAANKTVVEDTNIETTITEEDPEEEAEIPADASRAARRIARDVMAAVLCGSWLALLLQLA